MQKIAIKKCKAGHTLCDFWPILRLFFTRATVLGIGLSLALIVCHTLCSIPEKRLTSSCYQAKGHVRAS